MQISLRLAPTGDGQPHLQLPVTPYRMRRFQFHHLPPQCKGQSEGKLVKNSFWISQFIIHSFQVFTAKFWRGRPMSRGPAANADSYVVFLLFLMRRVVNCSNIWKRTGNKLFEAAHIFTYCMFECPYNQRESKIFIVLISIRTIILYLGLWNFQKILYLI